MWQTSRLWLPAVLEGGQGEEGKKRKRGTNLPFFFPFYLKQQAKCSSFCCFCIFFHLKQQAECLSFRFFYGFSSTQNDKCLSAHHFTLYSNWKQQALGSSFSPLVFSSTYQRALEHLSFCFFHWKQWAECSSFHLSCLFFHELTSAPVLIILPFSSTWNDECSARRFTFFCLFFPKLTST